MDDLHDQILSTPPPHVLYAMAMEAVDPVDLIYVPNAPAGGCTMVGDAASAPDTMMAEVGDAAGVDIVGEEDTTTLGSATTLVLATPAVAEAAFVDDSQVADDSPVDEAAGDVATREVTMQNRDGGYVKPLLLFCPVCGPNFPALVHDDGRRFSCAEKKAAPSVAAERRMTKDEEVALVMAHVNAGMDFRVSLNVWFPTHIVGSMLHRSNLL